jgi:hypothetical protein
MDYFKRLLQALSVEREEDRRQFHRLTQTLPVADRRENGMTWYPVAIRETEIGKGDYLTIELERTTHQDLLHQLRFGMSAALFSNHDAKKDRIEGTITHINGNRLKLSLREDELPDWTRNGKLGIDAVFDENSYDEMTRALQLAMQLAENRRQVGHDSYRSKKTRILLRRCCVYRPKPEHESTGSGAKDSASYRSGHCARATRYRQNNHLGTGGQSNIGKGTATTTCSGAE